MSKIESDWKAVPADFKEEERWKAYLTGIDELDIQDAFKRLNLSRPYKYGVTGGLRFIDFAECQMVALDEDDLKAVWGARAKRLMNTASEIVGEKSVSECPLCGVEIDMSDGAFSGEPLTEGLVCESCSDAKVIPARKQARQQTIPEE